MNLVQQLMSSAKNYFWQCVDQNPDLEHITCGIGDKIVKCANQIWFLERRDPQYLAIGYTPWFDNHTIFEATYSGDLDCDVKSLHFPPAPWMLDRMQGCLSSPDKIVNFSMNPCTKYTYPAFDYDIWYDTREDWFQETVTFCEPILNGSKPTNGSKLTTCNIFVEFPKEEGSGLSIGAYVGIAATALSVTGVAITVFACQRHKAKKWLKDYNPDGSYVDYVLGRKSQTLVNDRQPLVKKDEPKSSYSGII